MQFNSPKSNIIFTYVYKFKGLISCYAYHLGILIFFIIFYTHLKILYDYYKAYYWLTEKLTLCL